MEPELAKAIQKILPENRVGDTYAAESGPYLVMASVSGEDDVLISVYRPVGSVLPPPALARLNALNCGISGGAHAILAGHSQNFYRYHLLQYQADENTVRQCMDRALAEAAKGYRYITKGE